MFARLALSALSRRKCALNPLANLFGGTPWGEIASIILATTSSIRKQRFCRVLLTFKNHATHKAALFIHVTAGGMARRRARAGYLALKRVLY